MTLKLTIPYFIFEHACITQKNSQLYTVFPQIKAWASISYLGLLVVLIQDKITKFRRSGIRTRVLNVLRSSHLPNVPFGPVY